MNTEQTRLVKEQARLIKEGEERAKARRDEVKLCVCMPHRVEGGLVRRISGSCSLYICEWKFIHV